MLEPQDRNLMIESLRPPEGFELSHAVGTTFTLDLVALLSAPLAFTMFETASEGGAPDPVALLKAVREHAERITVFCQGGQIFVPPHDQLLYSHLEESVVEVTQKQGLFHPKVWAMRFVREGARPRYRVLCMSRNLTFDRSWDTVLRLDGELTRRKNAIARNHPLGDFVAELPRLAAGRLTRPRRVAIEQIGDELRRVDFELPAQVQDIQFWPLGIRNHRRWPFGQKDGLLVVSPFIGGSTLRRLAGSIGPQVLVSRVESIERLEDRAALEPFDVKVLNEAVEFEGAEIDDLEAESKGDEAAPLKGIHAKVYVANRGWEASMWVGSVNATDAAVNQNIEFAVELMGRRSKLGVETILKPGPDDAPGFEALLDDFEPSEECEPIDEVQDGLEAAAEDARIRLSLTKFAGIVDRQGDSGWRVTLVKPGTGPLKLPDDVIVRCWPVTHNPAIAARPLERRAADLCVFDDLSLESLTTFFGFEVTVKKDGRSHAIQFVLNVPLRGAPAGRGEAALRALLHDRERVLRYLLLVLAEAGGAMDEIPSELLGLGQTLGSETDHDAARDLELPLLEGLVRAFDRDPVRLSQIARLIEDLDGADGGADARLPEGFREIWQPIWEARARRRRK